MVRLPKEEPTRKKNVHGRMELIFWRSWISSKRGSRGSALCLYQFPSKERAGCIPKGKTIKGRSFVTRKEPAGRKYERKDNISKGSTLSSSLCYFISCGALIHTILQPKSTQYLHAFITTLYSHPFVPTMIVRLPLTLASTSSWDQLHNTLLVQLTYELGEGRTLAIPAKCEECGEKKSSP